MFPDIADIADIARLQRDFLARSVRFLAAEAGIRQFLDIGAGLPTADNTHEVAQRAAPESRIVYVDFSRPVGLTMLGIMGQLPDEDDPWTLVDRLTQPLAPGSYLALSDGTDTSDTLNQAIAACNAGSAGSYHLRSPDRIEDFFHGLEIVEPGVVRTSAWRPDPGVEGTDVLRGHALCGVGRKP
ncbi:SAM-dependent methyltransferase [Streptomyces sp. NPDC088115]|uniref:SAM-dependent methyltransferase n=1 Tax=Streptomyces sp. NPDC088115 TaxID=3365824 RepID=UPI00380B9C52